MTIQSTSSDRHHWLNHPSSSSTLDLLDLATLGIRTSFLLFYGKRESHDVWAERTASQANWTLLNPSSSLGDTFCVTLSNNGEERKVLAIIRKVFILWERSSSSCPPAWDVLFHRNPRRRRSSWDDVSIFFSILIQVMDRNVININQDDRIESKEDDHHHDLPDIFYSICSWWSWFPSAMITSFLQNHFVGFNRIEMEMDSRLLSNLIAESIPGSWIQEIGNKKWDEIRR